MTSDNKEPELQVISWYEEKDWKQLKSLLSDADLLPESYDEWLEMAESAIKEMQDQNIIVVKVTIDTMLFPAWCKERNKAPDAEARTLFAIETVQKQHFINNM